mmetsp:Transcript_86824/g.221181  ORF Transcript_86824/g.221181 Transcript_86824/m.221181 type:complete len:280 (-) Transcript_86824:273-1112(-)
MSARSYTASKWRCPASVPPRAPGLAAAGPETRSAAPKAWAKRPTERAPFAPCRPLLELEHDCSTAGASAARAVLAGSVGSRGTVWMSSFTVAWAVSARFWSSLGSKMPCIDDAGTDSWAGARGNKWASKIARSPSPEPRYRPRAKLHINMPNQSGRKGAAGSSADTWTSSAARHSKALSRTASTASPPGLGPRRESARATPDSPRGRRPETLAVAQLITVLRMISEASDESSLSLRTSALETAKMWCGSSAASTGLGYWAQNGTKMSPKNLATIWGCAA